MIRNLLVGSLLTVALSGCSAGALDNGIYYFFFPNLGTVELTCDTTVDYNADAVACPEEEEDSEFVIEQTSAGPETVVVGEIVELAYDGEEGYSHALVLYGLLEPDNALQLWGRQSGGVWTFVRDFSEEHTTSVEHESGDYAYEDHESTTITLTMEGEIKGGVFTGDFSYALVSEVTASETDEWEPADIGIFTPGLNVYVGDADLCEPGGGDDPDAFSYSSTDVECSARDCTLSVIETCSIEPVAVTGSLTSDDGDGVAATGSPADFSR